MTRPLLSGADPSDRAELKTSSRDHRHCMIKMYIEMVLSDTQNKINYDRHFMYGYMDVHEVHCRGKKVYVVCSKGDNAVFICECFVSIMFWLLFWVDRIYDGGYFSAPSRGV